MSLYDEVKQGSYKNAINKLAKKTEDIVGILESDNILDALGLEIARERGTNKLAIGGEGSSYYNTPVYSLGDNDIFAFIEKMEYYDNNRSIYSELLAHYMGSICYSAYINNSEAYEFASSNREDGGHTLNACYDFDYTDDTEVIAEAGIVYYTVIILRKKGE